MPDALISTTTSCGPGAGSGNSMSCNLRSPRKVTPRMVSSQVFAAPAKGTRYEERTTLRNAPELKSRQCGVQFLAWLNTDCATQSLAHDPQQSASMELRYPRWRYSFTRGGDCHGNDLDYCPSDSAA